MEDAQAGSCLVKSEREVLLDREVARIEAEGGIVIRTITHDAIHVAERCNGCGGSGRDTNASESEMADYAITHTGRMKPCPICGGHKTTLTEEGKKLAQVVMSTHREHPSHNVMR